MCEVGDGRGESYVYWVVTSLHRLPVEHGIMKKACVGSTESLYQTVEADRAKSRRYKTSNRLVITARSKVVRSKHTRSKAAFRFPENDSGENEVEELLPGGCSVQGGVEKICGNLMIE